MIGIENIAVYLPENYIDNRKRLHEFNITEEFLQTKTGVIRVARKKTEDDTSDLCCAAIKKLLNDTKVSIDDIDCLILCTQNPDGYGLPHTSAIVHGKLGFSKNCAVFDVSLGCSGYVYGLSIIKNFMEGNDFKRGILVTADPYSKVINENDKNTSLLFGDAATATFLSEQPKWKIGKFCFGSDGAYASALNVNSENRLLEMDGRAIFNFTAKVVPENIIKTIEKNGLTNEQIDRFILHQGSRYIRDTLVKRMGLDPDKVPFEATQYGNTISSSIPIILAKGSNSFYNILISGFGVGLSWGSTVLTKYAL